MTKVYVVWDGEYSDKYVAEIFSSEEMAQRYCDLHNEVDESSNFRVQEYELDRVQYSPSIEVKKYYIACITLEDYDEYKKGDFDDFYEEKRFYTKPVTVEVTDWTIYAASVNSMEEAKKVAIEKYQAMTQQKVENGET